MECFGREPAEGVYLRVLVQVVAVLADALQPGEDAPVVDAAALQGLEVALPGQLGQAKDAHKEIHGTTRNLVHAYKDG